MKPRSSKRWTVRVVRSDGRQAHTVTAGRTATVVGGLGLVVALLLLGAVLGRMWSSRSESGEIATLTREVETSRAEAQETAELSRRLETIERDYARLQAAVTEGAPSLRPAVALPTELDAGTRSELSASTPAWPLAQRGFITRSFGSRTEAAGERHPGIDIAVPNGSYVRAMRAGIIDDAGEDEVYGRFIRIAHGDGISSLYGHNSWLFVQPGDSVMRLQVIALSGSTGRSTAPHLHFEITRDGVLLDPLAFVNHGGDEVLGGVGQAGVAHR